MEKENKKQSKIGRILKWIIIAIIAIGLGIGATFGTLFFISKKHDENAQYLDNIKYIAKIDEGKYYIAQADQNISFWVKEKNEDYVLLDSKGKNVDSKIKVINDKYYIARELGFTEGETYTLIIKNNQFLDEKLANAKIVVFTIKRDEVAEYKYQDNVYEVNTQDLNIENNTLQNNTYKIGDILILKEDDEIVNAYKIQSTTGNTAKLEKPELSEIYSEFNLYMDMKLDYSNLVLHQDTLETSLKMREQQKNDKYANANFDQLSYNLEQQINEMPGVKYIKTEAKKTGNNVKTGVDFKNEDGKLTVEFTINVEANGEKFLGIDALSKHDLEMKLTFEIAHDFLVDINLGKSFSVACNLTECLSVDINLTSKIDHDGFSGLTDDEYDKTVQDIIARIEGEKSDTASGRATIGALEVPTGIPGVNVYFDLYFQTDIHLSLDATYNQKMETSQTLGVVFLDKSFKPFMDSTTPEISFDFNLFGKATAKLGIGMDIGLSLISKDFANVNLGNEFGLYGEAYAVMHAGYTSNDNPNRINAYAGGMVEAGTYYQATFNANINLLFKSFKFSHNIAEVKRPFLKIGEDQIVAGIKPETKTVEVTETSAQIPLIYRQLLTFKDGGKITEEEIPIEYLKFTDEKGNDVTKTGVEFNEDGKFKVIVKYEELDGKEYNTEITFINKTTQKVIKVPLTLPTPTTNKGTNKKPQQNTNTNINTNTNQNTEITETPQEEEEDLPITREFTLEEAMELAKRSIASTWEDSGFEKIPEFKYKYEKTITIRNGKECYVIYVYTEEDINMQYPSADWKQNMPGGYHYQTLLIENKVINDEVFYYIEYQYEDYAEGMKHYLIEGRPFSKYYNVKKDEMPEEIHIFGY